jgi:hypothetical protein
LVTFEEKEHRVGHREKREIFDFRYCSIILMVSLWQRQLFIFIPLGFLIPLLCLGLISSGKPIKNTGGSWPSASHLVCESTVLLGQIPFLLPAFASADNSPLISLADAKAPFDLWAFDFFEDLADL